MNNVDLVIIYVPNEGDANCIGAHFVNREWKYSKPVFIPANEVNQFIQEELVFRGMLVFDCRESAGKQNPGMEYATPILVYRPEIAIERAVEAAAVLHKAILETQE